MCFYFDTCIIQTRTNSKKASFNRKQVYTMPEKCLCAQIFVRIGLAFARYLSNRTNIHRISGTKACSARSEDKL